MVRGSGRRRAVQAAVAAGAMVAASMLAGPGTAQAAGCDAWAGRYTAAPQIEPGNAADAGVAAVSACDVWIVSSVARSVGSGTVTQTLTEHWTGGQQPAVVPSPNPAQGPLAANVLTAVSAASATNAWAVGYYTEDRSTRHGLLLHWDGSTWTQVATPGISRLTAVSATSASNVWAAGVDDLLQPVFLHNTGTGWTRAPSPTITPNGGNVPVAGLSATSPSDAWAVGDLRTTDGSSPVIYHWDGSQWSRMPGPDGAPAGTFLTAVSATSPTDVWAAGLVSVGVNLTNNVILHWDGQHWQLKPSPNPGTGSDGFVNQVTALTAASPFNAWAVGVYKTSGQNVFHNLLLHWNGQSWALMPTPDPADFLNQLVAVAASPDGSLWLAGAAAPVSLTPQRATVIQLVKIPDVIGMTVHDAQVTMAGAGLVTQTRAVTPPAPGCNPATADTVIATSPPPRALAAPPVTLAFCNIPS